MRIGIDIDNVISNFNEALLKEFLNHDKKLRNKGIINQNADFVTKGMFDWSNEEVDDFYSNNIERIAENLDVILGAKEYIDRLKQDGHIIYIITGRENDEYQDPYHMTTKWLAEKEIYYDQLIFTNAYDQTAKAKKCKEFHIDVMIDDSVSNCVSCVENHITTLLMDTPYNKNVNMTRVYNWKEIYDFIKNQTKEK